MIKRRDFLKWIYRTFIGLWGAGILWIFGSYMKAPEKRGGSQTGWVNAGALSEIEIGGSKLFSYSATPVWIIRIGEKDLIALSALCTHMHCVIKWKSETKTFECPCHKGEFSIEGNVLAGIPTKPLIRYRVEIKGDEVYVII
ncbi:MAG: hypothetical protein A2Y62_11325 [Candidatus Fischerbacteria bacterium RBG_13_37_8]|uniref:Rieske domain-containing protein n=1 Tax=Candidatus Fischerbacteria bacterium RBG_13_37_8 TaxID=1817863 RepID=A0A1F5VY79_9BACT|nr:MAG: hypothetical protein A2Y62_11325 [Candidatus Fischerbacteria bacterium RBG_13_37_8]